MTYLIKKKICLFLRNQAPSDAPTQQVSRKIHTPAPEIPYASIMHTVPHHVPNPQPYWISYAKLLMNSVKHLFFMDIFRLAKWKYALTASVIRIRIKNGHAVLQATRFTTAHSIIRLQSAAPVFASYPEHTDIA